nr:hypothetical protein Iba_chr02aCG18140 [Ipomoea batatas]GMC63403.1 hypothetical protein Iba_chr02cCG13040 [Ipomoea batatas]
MFSEISGSCKSSQVPAHPRKGHVSNVQSVCWSSSV